LDRLSEHAVSLGNGRPPFWDRSSRALVALARQLHGAPALATLDVLLRHRGRPDQYISGFETLKDAVHKDGGF
jgi:hypothetical protein